MKRNLLALLSVIAIFCVVMIYFNDANTTNNDLTEIEQLRKSHRDFLDNSPFKDRNNLSRTERKQMGLPPNAYNEQVFELTMDPNTGRPMPERLIPVQEEMKMNRILKRDVGGSAANPWKSRGPNNQGGRTRGIMFDPNDSANKRVFAGSVSGGLWVNQDITDENSGWTLVAGMPANVAVNVIISDPNDPQIFYIGAGESYTSGDAVGRGIWKSTNGGTTWSNIFGGYDDFIESDGTGFVFGIFYINDLVARNNGGTTELYAAVAGTIYGSARSPNNFHGLIEMGLYKSNNGGTSWSRFDIRNDDTSYKNPCDLEIDINNNIWLTTTRNVFGNQGGDIYRSTNGITFDLINTIPGTVYRTELEVSSTDANKFWVAAERGLGSSRKADLFVTTNAFSSIATMSEPIDLDSGIPEDDYARGQAFYNLLIEADQNNRLYIGGIDLFYTDNDGADWTQISKWNDSDEFTGFNGPLVHADQHAIVFRPNSSDNEVAIGNDGGVYYSADISAASSNANAIQKRDKNYVTMQFYYGTIDVTGESDGDDLAGGSQDNGTQFLVNAQLEETNPFSEVLGGDGAYTEIDDSGQYAITTFTYNSHLFVNYPQLTNGYFISTSEEEKAEEDDPTINFGSFINQAALDKNLDILYSNASFTKQNELNQSVTTYQIERVSNFQNGEAGIQRKFLINEDVFDNRPSAFKVSPFTTTSTTLLVGLITGKILKLENADQVNPVWSVLSTPNFVGSISDIEFGRDENELFVTMHNYGVNNIWYSSNGGVSWRAIEGNLPDLPVKCILQNPLELNELIIGTELGVWTTSDFTATNVAWETSYNGMNDVTVLDLDLRPSDNLVLATTYGRGMFTSKFTSSLGVEDEKLKDNLISVYPTVSNGNLQLKAKKNLGKAAVEVYNINGQKLYSNQIDLGASSQPLTLNLAGGIYFVNINVDNYSETKKIIIK